MTWNAETLKKLIARGRLTTTAATAQAAGKNTLKIGGGTDDGKKYVIRFVHTDAADGDLRVTIVGKNEAGLELAFAKDAETVVNPEFTALPHDNDGTLIQIDETPAIVNQVRKRDDEPTSLCYMWNFRTSELLKDIPAVIIFHFDESRGTEVLEECLPGYVGVIMSDGHSPYHGFAEKSGGTVTNAGCLNHARTRFARVLRANPELRKLAAEGRKEVPACKAIELFKKIFREESKLKDACPDDRLKGRQEKVRPVFEELSAYIKSFGADDFDQSGLMYDALQYFINQEKYLRGFLDDPLIPAHNSACERDNAGFAVLRNNIKFIDSISGAVATADLYSLAATAKAHNIDFFSYMRYVLKELPAFLADQSSRDYRNMEGLDAFLPWSPECRTKIEEEWDRRKEIVSSGSLFPREDMHRAVTKRLRALQAGQ